MHLWLEKWGSAAGALLCALVIVFAAVYTRQDEMRKPPAQNAAADQNQTLKDVSAPRYALPADAPLLSGFRGAYRENGLWRFDPCVCYQTSPGQEVRAVAAGTVTQLSDGKIEIAHENNLISCYQGTFSVAVKTGETVSFGQRIARMTKESLRFSLRQDDCFIDPEAFFAQNNVN